MKHGHAITGQRTDTYSIWCGIRSRCSNPKDKAYPNYGGRGITVCERWSDFQNFLHDMGERPSKKHSVDRINNDGNYEPGNCRWATAKQQVRNTRRTIYITIDGRTLPASEWCELESLDYDAFFYRYQQGWGDEECIFGRSPANSMTYEGVTKTIREWSETSGVKYRTLIRRFRDFGWTPEECLLGKSPKNSTKKVINITYKGRTQSMCAWCKELGLHQATVYGRYRKSKDPEVLFSIPRGQAQ